jgi:hypothetical protein
MANAQAKVKELDNSINEEQLKKDVAKGFDNFRKNKNPNPPNAPVKGSIEDKMQIHVQNMERAKEIYLRSLGALEVLETLKKEKVIKNGGDK